MCTVVQSLIGPMGEFKTLQALVRPAWNSHSEEQRGHPTLLGVESFLYNVYQQHPNCRALNIFWGGLGGFQAGHN